MPRRSNNALVANVRLGYSLGWSFTPLAGKRPILKGWQKRPREAMEEAMAWAAQGNVGLRTGRTSGVVVIDVDEGGDIPVPDFAGKTMREVTEACLRLGLNPILVGSRLASQQSPAAGSKVRRGSKVTVQFGGTPAHAGNVR